MQPSYVLLNQHEFQVGKILLSWFFFKFMDRAAGERYGPNKLVVYSLLILMVLLTDCAGKSMRPRRSIMLGKRTSRAN